MKSSILRAAFGHAVIISALALSIVACSATTEVPEDTASLASDFRAGPCANKPIDAAIKCATRPRANKSGARILSYYRDPKDQERVRRENGCTNRCIGGAGCIRATAGCTTSPHTKCTAVDLINDGAPLTRNELRECGLAKTKAPHANHYDLVGRPPVSDGDDDQDNEDEAPIPQPRPDGPADEDEGAPTPRPRPGDDPRGTAGRCNRVGGLYCGNPRSALQGDPDSLYECVANVMTLIQKCPAGCRVNDVGVDDACR